MAENANGNLAVLLTPPGSAAIAVVRIEGPAVGSFLAATFSRPTPIGRPVHGELHDGRRVIDDPVVARIADDVADICLHGGAWVVHAFFELVRSKGFAVLDHTAVPLSAGAVDGETTIEQEVAAWLPAARTELALQVLLAQPAAWSQLMKDARADRKHPPAFRRDEGGGEGGDINPRPTHSDEHAAAADKSSARKNEISSPANVSPLTPSLPCAGRSAVLDQSTRDRLLTDRTLHWLLNPPRVAIVGTANVGKSTLVNHLLARERVITADLPGTTRDWVSEIADVNGLAVVLLDTPGIRATTDAVEQHAIALSRPVMEQSDAVVLVLDPTQPMEPEQAALVRRFPGAITVINKTDRGKLPFDGAIHTIATTGQGVDDLRRRIAARFQCDSVDCSKSYAWTDRQRAWLMH
jgi:tRNA modification GTPase